MSENPEPVSHELGAFALQIVDELNNGIIPDDEAASIIKGLHDYYLKEVKINRPISFRLAPEGQND